MFPAAFPLAPKATGHAMVRVAVNEGKRAARSVYTSTLCPTVSDSGFAAR
jgi:hypothetical protein